MPKQMGFQVEDALYDYIISSVPSSKENADWLAWIDVILKSYGTMGLEC